MSFPFPPGAITNACSAASEGLLHAAMHSKNVVAAVAAEGLVHAAQLDAKAVASAAVTGARSAATEGIAYAAQNPKNVAGAAVVAGGLLVVAVPAMLTAPILAAAGFGSSGPIAGTIAAGAQAGIGNIVGGSVFATLQSAAMGGYGAAAVAAAAQGAGGVVAAAGGVAMGWFNRGKL